MKSCNGNGRNEILQQQWPQQTKTKATTTHTHHMIMINNDPAMAATNVTYFPTVWPQKNGLKTSFSKENLEKQDLKLNKHPKSENCRINAVYPLSFPDFNHSARDSLLKCPLTCWKCVTHTVVTTRDDVGPYLGSGVAAMSGLYFHQNSEP